MYIEGKLQDDTIRIEGTLFTKDNIHNRLNCDLIICAKRYDMG